MTAKYLVLALIAGCDLDDVTPAKAPCADPAALKLRAIEGVPTAARLDVTLFGEIDRPSDVTISELSVGAAKATSELGSFDKFRVDVPVAEIMRHVPADAVPTMTVVAPLPVITETNCAAPAIEIGTVDFNVPPRSTEMLDVSLASPSAFNYLPPRTTPVELELSAAVVSAGATVHVESTSGTIVGAVDGNVILDKSGTASLHFVPDGKEGTALITARSGSATDNLSLSFIGAPSIFPSGIPAYVDTPLIVEVNARGGRLKGCRAAAPPGVSVSSGTSPDVTNLTVNDDLNDVAVATVTILATSSAPMDSIVSLRCYDVYDQVTTAAYTVRAN